MSLAPERIGIGIQRHFTSAGVHPYDELVWELRDARISNYRDGSVAFEQLGVEFPVTWSLNATNIVAQKYFRGTLGTPEREHSLRQVIDRVADTISDWGIAGGYFVDEAEAEAFRAELKHLLVHQKAAFNSPVWFNIGVKGVPQQASACFILAVEDSMDSILNWYREEGIIFKGGSGSGVNLSRIRSSSELLKGGGTASGPVSFMRGADASAGTIKSGGKTRRAAKMVILNADHPDVEEFIWCKAKEERKARVLRDAGFDMDLDGSDSFSIQYQNANNSVRVTDEFMDAVEADADWELRAVISGEVIRRVPARQLFRDIARAAWECADPGLQFDTTINRWHTAATTGRINGSNPCFTGDTYVHTDKGLVQFVELVDRVRLGETFGVYTHDATSPEAPAERVEITSPDAVMITGFNEIVRLELSNGMELRCTAGHRLFTANRGYVRADELIETDEIRVLDQLAPAVAADWCLPVPAEVDAYVSGDRRQFTGIELPEKWSEELAHYVGWLVGDGCVGGDTATTVYGGPEEVAEVLPGHQALLAGLNGGTAPKPSVQANGTRQLRSTRRAVARFVEALGVSSGRASEKVLPWSIEQAPSEVAAAFLRGLFDADGCVYDGAKSRYVGLGSSSRVLLKGVQRLLTTMGVFSSIYATRHATADEGAFSYVRKDGSVAIYDAKPMFDLRISSRSIARFAEAIGFGLPSKRDRLTALVAEHRFNATRDQSVRLVRRSDDGVELTYNLSEPRNHSYVVNGILVANCSEYVHLDNSACNLASLNLLKFLRDDDTFDVEGFKAGVEVVFTAQEILVGNADYPTPGIADTTRRFRQLGLGYANLGALLMALGQPYDSDEGRALAAAITSLMTGHAYATSARIAGRMGPFAGFADNEEHMLRVLSMHRDAASCIDEELVPTAVLSAAQLAWDDAVAGGEEFGVRNSQASVLAPTGCLVGGTLVATDRGLRRLATLGNVDGAEWQDVSFRVLTDDGEQDATKFYVNGLETVVDLTTERGYRIQGTPQHRVKVVDEHGAWAWRRFAELRPGDRVPLALDQLVGEPQVVTLPPLTETMGWAGEHHLVTPATVTPELAELVGMFMGDGSLHARGLRFRVAEADFDVVAHLERLAKELFGIQVVVTADDGHQQVAMNSVRLAEWWRACGFAKHARPTGPAGDGDVPHVPEAVLAANDRATYAAFLRGLFEAEGTVTAGYPTWTTTAESFKHDVQSLMLALGYVTSTKHDVSRRGSALLVLRLLNRTMNERWLSEIGFISARKAAKVDTSDLEQSWRHDHVPVSRALLERVAPDHEVALKEFRRSDTITRRLALELLERSGDAELAQLTGYFYDRVVRAELGDEQLTYDLSVPSNVTYLANGFVSHNTIGLMMDCDTTGIEPDLGLVKFKKLVGGGSMSIVNQTVPRALRRLGYSAQQIDEIVRHIDEHKTIVGAPNLRAEHLAVFACSMGDNTIHYTGHVRMMGAVQPFISGAISKTVNMPEDATVEEVEALHFLSWQLGLKAVAIYRDNCKVGQPLSTAKKDDPTLAATATAPQIVERIVEKLVHAPVRQKLPRTRTSKTFEFRVADCKGFATIGEYADGRPGEIFLTVSKQGSTLSGIMDAFAKAISYGLQYGVPLRAFVEAFTNMRFEPAGMTDDPDIRFASSIMDYLFRRLALEYLTYEERAELSIFSIDERMQPTLPGVEESVTETVQGGEMAPDPKSIPSVSELAVQMQLESSPLAAPEPPAVAASDAPLCMQCGVHMQRAGSCYACPSCGSTSGCS